MSLRPYHNPENVDESRVPDGWRFRYEGERPNPKTPTKVWMRPIRYPADWSRSADHHYHVDEWTFIVLINA